MTVLAERLPTRDHRELPAEAANAMAARTLEQGQHHEMLVAFPAYHKLYGHLLAQIKEIERKLPLLNDMDDVRRMQGAHQYLTKFKSLWQGICPQLKHEIETASEDSAPIA